MDATQDANSGRRALVTPVRAAIAVAFLLLAALEWKQLHRPAYEVFDVQRRAHEIARASPAEKSLTDSYYMGPGGSAHLHVLGRGVTCQLHLHEHTEEATVPVMGEPIVTQRFGDQVRRARYPDGALIVSPPYCAHEWRNPLADEDHASLVFTLGAVFPGNLWVRDTDPRIARGGAPILFDPFSELATFAASGERTRVIALPVTPGSIDALFVRESAVVARGPEAALLLYTVAGSGTLTGLPEQVSIAPGILIVVNRRGVTMTIAADAGHLLALYAVRMPT